MFCILYIIYFVLFIKYYLYIYILKYCVLYIYIFKKENTYYIIYNIMFYFLYLYYIILYVYYIFHFILYFIDYLLFYILYFFIIYYKVCNGYMIGFSPQIMRYQWTSHGIYNHLSHNGFVWKRVIKKNNTEWTIHRRILEFSPKCSDKPWLRVRESLQRCWQSW